MTSLLTTATFSIPEASGGPDWNEASLDSEANNPGSSGLDAVVDAFSPKYLGTGTSVNGWLCTTTAVSRFTDAGGSIAFSNKKTFDETTSCRQMQASRGSQGWVMVISYDGTNGTKCYYTRDGGVTWGTSVVSSSTNSTYGEIWMPGLWVSERVAGLAVCTAFSSANAGFGGSNDTPTGSNTWRRRFTPNSTNGAQGLTIEGTLSANGIDFALDAYPNAHAYAYGSLDLPSGCTVTTMYFKMCANPFRINEIHYVVANGTFESATLGSNCGGNSAKSGMSYTADGTYGWYAYDQRPHVSGASSAYIYDLNIEGTGTSPFGAAGSGAAYVTINYGQTWTKITDASIVGYVQPGPYLCGAIEAPYTDTNAQRFVYGYINTDGTYPVPRLHRVSGSTVTDISPVADGKTYGVPHNKPHRRAVFISEDDANVAILCGESRNASTGVSTYRVFRTTNLWSASPTWAALSAESASEDWRGGYLTTRSRAHFLGGAGRTGFWTPDFSVVDNRIGDSANSSKALGLMGI